jgi:DNA-binding transcriptional LysR family regulator
MLEFRDFEIVSAIVQTGSLSGAAQALSMTQPALTKALSAVETDIGAKLFLRGPVGMEPTSSAEALLRRWQGIYGNLVDIRREIDGLRGVNEGLLRIATGYLAASSSEMAMGALNRKFPSLLLEARHAVWTDVTAAVRRGDVDIGITDPSDAETDPDLVVEHLSEPQAYFVCRSGHPILGHSDLTLDEIVSYPFALNLIPHRLARHMQQSLNHHGFRMTATGHLLPQIAIQSISAIRNVLMTSNAMTIMPQRVLAEIDHGGQFVKIESFAPEWLKLRLSFIMRAQATKTPAMIAFINEVRRIESNAIQALNSD